MKKFFDKLYKGSSEVLYDELNRRLLENEKTMIVTANPEIFMKAKENPLMETGLLDEQTLITPDGEGVVYACKQLGYEIKGKIAGVDTVEKLFEMGNKHHLGLYIYGSQQEVLDALEIKLSENYPNLKILGLKNGYTNKKEDVFSDMLEKKPDIVLVALGVPRQELAILEYFKQFDKGIFVGCGGSLDVLSGKKQRAPKIFIKLKLEWAYRLAKEPKRIKRFYDSNVKFLFVIKKLQKEGK